MKAVNLLPSDQRSAKSPSAKVKQPVEGSAFGAFAVLGALGLAVIAVAAMVLTNNSISERTAELAATQARAQAVSRQVAALKPYADFKQLAEARVQTVSQLATTRFDWEQTLRDLSRALPRDVRLSGLKGTAGGASAATTGTASPSIELSGCTRSQTAVARLMARLRAVRGVTRVALKSSAKSAAVTGGSVTGGDTAQSLCGKGRRPTFALSIIFERFNVPVVNALPAPGAVVAPGTAPGAAPTPGATPAPGTPAPGTTPAAPGTTPATPSTNPSTQGVSAP